MLAPLAGGERTLAIRPGREVRQNRVTLPDGKSRLLRVVVDVVGDDMKVVAVYRASRLAKYWRARCRSSTTARRTPSR
jgi:hypothetical protein